jgi:hypothetical protein
MIIDVVREGKWKAEIHLLPKDEEKRYAVLFFDRGHYVDEGVGFFLTVLEAAAYATSKIQTIERVSFIQDKSKNYQNPANNIFTNENNPEPQIKNEETHPLAQVE